jgi:hypothetical protein
LDLSASSVRGDAAMGGASNPVHGPFIDIFYQLTEIFDLLRHDGMRTLYAFEYRRRVGNG